MTRKKTRKPSLTKRIYALEKLFKSPPGTQIVRTLTGSDKDAGTAWCIGFGQLMAPKTFFSGKTIGEALTEAENAITTKGFVNDPWKRLERNVEKQKL